jgi:LAS superfamily LD-carboxypeptidase LdcB
MLNPLELTGRASTHVREVPELRSTLHHEAVAQAFALIEAARAAGIDLAIVSGFRDFDRQVAIWNGKFSGERPLLDRDSRLLSRVGLDEPARVNAILLWSALPGASRHHWGTDIDVIDRAAIPPGYRWQLAQQEFASAGPFARLNGWLAQNLHRFGFFRPYTTDRGGVQPEPWHLSYAPVAASALTALSLEVLEEVVAGSSMLGRESVLARLPELYEKYVISVDPPESVD